MDALGVYAHLIEASILLDTEMRKTPADLKKISGYKAMILQAEDTLRQFVEEREAPTVDRSTIDQEAGRHLAESFSQFAQQRIGALSRELLDNAELSSLERERANRDAVKNALSELGEQYLESESNALTKALAMGNLKGTIDILLEPEWREFSKRRYLSQLAAGTLDGKTRD